jgi:hypothetical protein
VGLPLAQQEALAVQAQQPAVSQRQVLAALVEMQPVVQELRLERQVTVVLLMEG